MLEKIKEKLENSDYIFINKSKFISTQNINFNLWDSFTTLIHQTGNLRLSNFCKINI
ncbi:hypothetical protein [Mesomycoplasma dispar]|uniref:hypothetical protein n=1 Tax=Mesomycoplasma dispar TaxID=86660 RepID=UPI000A6C4233|nr:hypothetical protein [Mesomycoplasma dispar]